MRDKIISFIIGAILGGIIVYGYTYFSSSDSTLSTQSTNLPGQFGPRTGSGANFDTSNLSDEQLENIASRAGISVSELKAKLDSGENLRDIIGGSRTRGINTNSSGSIN